MTCITRSISARRVLLIEDDPDLAELLRHILASWGCEVRVAGDGVQGLETARAFLPRIVICDIGLPRLDGYGVARALRADPAFDGLYAIALTALTSPDHRRQVIAAGFDVHIAKPFTLHALENALSNAESALSNAEARAGTPTSREESNGEGNRPLIHEFRPSSAQCPRWKEGDGLTVVLDAVTCRECQRLRAGRDRCASRSNGCGTRCAGKSGHPGLHHAQVARGAHVWTDDGSPTLATDLVAPT